jgi:hypothetical protein
MSMKEKVNSAKEVLSGEKGLTKIYSSEKNYTDEMLAKAAFEEAKERLYDVNSWSKIPGPENATFILYDNNGVEYKGEWGGNRLKKGDFIKTLLPGNLPENWVEVIEVHDNEDSAYFTVRPSHAPPSEHPSSRVTKHFFKKSARSIFKVEKRGTRLIASETGINESINNKDPEAGERNLLNTIISEAGWAFVQQMQWQNVTNYLVGKIEIKE